MKNEPLQETEDFYKNLGYKGEQLRKVLLNDKKYRKLIDDKKKKLTKNFKVTSNEKKKYVLSTNEDYEI